MRKVLTFDDISPDVIKFVMSVYAEDIYTQIDPANKDLFFDCYLQVQYVMMHMGVIFEKQIALYLLNSIIEHPAGEPFKLNSIDFVPIMDEALELYRSIKTGTMDEDELTKQFRKEFISFCKSVYSLRMSDSEYETSLAVINAMYKIDTDYWETRLPTNLSGVLSLAINYYLKQRIQNCKDIHNYENEEFIMLFNDIDSVQHILSKFTTDIYDKVINDIEERVSNIGDYIIEDFIKNQED